MVRRLLMILSLALGGASEMDRRMSCQWKKNGILLTVMAVVTAVGQFSTGRHLQGQLLQKIRTEASGEVAPETDPPPDKKKNRSDDHHRSHDHRDHGNDWSLIGFFFNQNGKRNSGHRDCEYENDIDYEIYSSSAPKSPVLFAGRPYALGRGILLDENAVLAGQKSQWRAAFWYGTDFHQIDSWNLHGRYENSSVIGFDFQWAHLTEKVLGLPDDHLNLGDFNLTTRLIESEDLILRLGAGGNFLSDRNASFAGYNLTSSIDWFPVEPVVLSFEIDYGKVGSIHQTHLLATAGVTRNHLEFLTGYESRKLGSTVLSGPLLGIRAWW